MRILALVLMLVSFNALALDLQYYKFTHNPTYSSTDNALLDRGLIRNDYPWIFNASYDYVRTPLSIELDGKRDQEIVKYMQSLSFGGAWHPTDDLLIGLRSRFSRLTNDESTTVLGDTFLDGIWKFYQGENTALALHPRLTLPTGANDYSTQERKVGGYLGINLERKFEWFQGVINIGYSHEPGAVLNLGADYSKVDYKDSLFTAIGTIFPLVEDWTLNIEAYRYNNLKGNQHPNEIYAGIRHQFMPTLAGFAGIAGGGIVDESSNDYRFSAGVKFYPEGEQKRPIEKATPILVAEPKPVAKPLSKREEVLKKEAALHGKMILAQNVYFANGSSVLNDLSQGLLAKIAAKVKGKENSMTIVLEGFASSRGNSAANLVLSDKRSKVVRDFLKSKGVGDTNIKTVAYGDSKAEGGSNEALDRKVMMRVYSK